MHKEAFFFHYFKGAWFEHNDMVVKRGNPFDRQQGEHIVVSMIYEAGIIFLQYRIFKLNKNLSIDT